MIVSSILLVISILTGAVIGLWLSRAVKGMIALRPLTKAATEIHASRLTGMIDDELAAAHQAQAPGKTAFAAGHDELACPEPTQARPLPKRRRAVAALIAIFIFGIALSFIRGEAFAPAGGNGGKAMIGSLPASRPTRTDAEPTPDELGSKAIIIVGGREEFAANRTEKMTRKATTKTAKVTTVPAATTVPSRPVADPGPTAVLIPLKKTPGSQPAPSTKAPATQERHEVASDQPKKPPASQAVRSQPPVTDDQSSGGDPDGVNLIIHWPEASKMELIFKSLHARLFSVSSGHIDGEIFYVAGSPIIDPVRGKTNDLSESYRILSPLLLGMKGTGTVVVMYPPATAEAIARFKSEAIAALGGMKKVRSIAAAISCSGGEWRLLRTGSEPR